MFKILVFVAVLQIAGNFLLTVGVGLWAFTPWLFVIHRHVYGRPLSVEDARTQLPRASRLGGWLTAGAFVLIGIAAFTKKVAGLSVLGVHSDSSFFTYTQVLRMFAEYMSRNLVAAVVFSAIFLYVVQAEWRTTVRMSGDLRAEHDAQMRALEQYMASPAAPAQPTRDAQTGP
jgi:hypothetical protein